MASKERISNRIALTSVGLAFFLLLLPVPKPEVVAQQESQTSYRDNSQAMDTRRTLIFLPGFRNTPEVDWFIKAKPVLSGMGIDATMVRIPPEMAADHDYFLQAVDDAVLNAPADEIEMAGFSQGAGALEEYLATYNPAKKIKRATFISGRNLFQLDWTEVPEALKFFYRQLPAKAVDRVRAITKKVGVSFGLRDQVVLPHNGWELAEALEVEKPNVFDVKHEETVDNPYVLRKVLDD